MSFDERQCEGLVIVRYPYCGFSIKDKQGFTSARLDIANQLIELVI